MNTPKLELTRAERRLRLLLKLICLLYVSALLLMYLIPAMTGWPPFMKPFAVVFDPVYANNSAFKAGLFIVLAFVAQADVRRYGALIKVIIVASIIGLISCLLLLFFAKNNYEIPMPGNPVTIKRFLLISFILDAVIVIVLAIFYRKAKKSVSGDLRYFGPQQFQTLQAIAEVVIYGEEEKISPKEIAANVDRYLSEFRAKSKWLAKLVLVTLEYFPLTVFKPPLSVMHPQRRLQFLKNWFQYNDVKFRPWIKPVKNLLGACIRMAKQLTYIGYYNDPAVFESIGYKPFSQRPDMAERLKEFPPVKAPHLKVLQETDIPGDYKTDVIIIGSGAAACLIAWGLLRKGRLVTLVEKGGYEHPEVFEENEMAMISKLYADGALQISRDFRFQILQGSCVGGSTVVNNAVCFDTPTHIIARWKAMVPDFDTDFYKKCMAEVNKIIGTATPPQMSADRFLNPGGKKFKDGCQHLGLDQKPHVFDVVSANINQCVGCGYCNIGCRYGKKLSMIDNVLPRLQKEFGDQLKIIPACEVVKINKKGKKIESLTGKFQSGRTLRIVADSYVVSAGAVSSSILLLNSKLGLKMAGKKLSFNLASPLTAAFDEPVNSHDGLQISHYLQVANAKYILETWYNPPMSQAGVMPGWFEEHYQNMQDFSKMACVGVLVGTASNATVRNRGALGREIDYVPTKEDFQSLLEGIEKAAEIYLAAGANRVMPSGWKYLKYNNVDDLKKNFKKSIREHGDITLGTGHPQGGNVMATNPNEGVVGADCKVFGIDNLYVCDASVFPTSTGVNPQVTVMSMGLYAARFIK